MSAKLTGLHSLESMPASMSKLPDVVEEDPAETIAQLLARVHELETEQGLMQRELDSITQEAQRADSHLRRVSN